MPLHSLCNLYSPGNSVAIFIRGAPSSGKSVLAKHIMEKEQSMGNDKIVYLTVNEFYESPPGNAAMDFYREKMRKMVAEEFSRESSQFYVLEVAGGPIEEFEKLYKLAMEKENVTCYLIECKQSVDTCLKYVNMRVEEMRETVRLIEEEIPNEDVILIDAKDIYMENPNKKKMTDLMNKSSKTYDYTSSSHSVPSRFEKLDNPYSRIRITGDLTDLSKHVADLMKEPDILDLIQSSVANISFKETLVSRKSFENLTEVEPKNCFDYNHKKTITDEDVLFSFKPRTVIDYDHRSSKKLREIVEDVEIDIIISNKKSRMMREKVLKNYEMAENPEDIQSSSTYPNNWVSIR